MQEQLLTSRSEHWCTPPEIKDRVCQVDTIGLDPAGNIHSIIDAQLVFDFNGGQDGLLLSWQHQGLVYINPPYGRALPKWTKKIAAEALLGTEIVALLPARTDTKWFHEHILPYAQTMLFYKGRIKFIDGTTGKRKHSATFPSIFVYFGKRSKKFKKAFKDTGYFLDV
jgi:site-specific DNA-methyltransferase (adenine-specific)